MTEGRIEDLFDNLEKFGAKIPDSIREKISYRINKKLEYTPRVGIFGKTGAGKSSLCNALFGQDACDVSDVSSCTREAQEVGISFGKKEITLIDVPGVGENSSRDAEYADLYRRLLPSLDLIIWVVKGDDRALTTDEEFYNNIVKHYMKVGMPFIVALNQVDKIEPFRDWDCKNNAPGHDQLLNIRNKIRIVSGFFGIPIRDVVAVSASERFGLIDIVDTIVSVLPNDKKIFVLNSVIDENKSESAKTEAKEGFIDSVVDVIAELFPLVKVAKEPIKKIIKSVSDWKIWPWNW